MAELNSMPTPMDEMNTALEACEFGRFHVKLLFFSFIGSMAGVLVYTTTSFLLPSAECDLNMDLVQKGFLTASTHLGVTVSSIVAGFLTDTFGRKISLVAGYGGMFIFALVAASSQSYEVLIAAKFLEGIMLSTSVSAIIYLSEFCHKGIRDRILICQSSFTSIAGIISPLMAWGILTQDWRVDLVEGYIVINTWNFYLFIMSLWAFFACITYSTLPESPKYLITQKKFKEAKEILIKMYEANTRKPGDTFPSVNLWMNEIKLNNEDCGDKIKISFQEHIVTSLKNMKCLFKKPLFMLLVLLCVSKLLLMGKSNVVISWFPQLSTIVEYYNISEDKDLCAMLDTYTNDLKIRAINATVSSICIPAKSGAETYINSIIVGFVSLLTFFISGALLNKVGKKPLLIITGLISVGITLGLRWTNSKVALVALFSIDLAIAQIIKNLQEMVTIELFPTAIRTVTISIIMMCARIGTLMANIAFPILLDIGCVVPFFSMTAMMACVTVISLFFPTKK